MATVYDTAVLADAPVAYYKLNEPAASGVAIDAISGNNAAYGGGSTLGVNCVVPGDNPNTAVNLAASATALLTLPAVAFVHTTDPGCTLEFWANFAAVVATTNFTIGPGTAGGYFYVILPYTSNAAYLCAGSTAAGILGATVAGSVTGALHHWAFTFLNSSPWTAVLYRDGVSVASGVGTGAWTVNLTGGLLAQNMPVNTKLQDLAIYNKVLTPTQLLAHYNAGVHAQAQAAIAARTAISSRLTGALTARAAIAGTAAFSATSPVPLSTVTYDVYRSEAGENQWVRIATAIAAPPIGQSVEYDDYEAQSWKQYDYRIDSIGSSGSPGSYYVYNKSMNWDIGIWLHDPEDVANSVYYFMYDSGSRGEVSTPEVALIKVDGRNKPIAEFSGRDVRTASVYLDMPWNPTLHKSPDYLAMKAFVESHKVLCFRDHRGRKLYGILGTFTESDEKYRYTTTITVTEVDYSEAV